MIQEFNNEKYRVCLTDYLDEDNESYAYSIELSLTDGEGGKVLVLKRFLLKNL